MNAKKDSIDVADDLLNSIGYMRTLLSAAQDKTEFYLANRKLLGPQGELLYICAQELNDLLDLTGRFLSRMEAQMDSVTDLIYASEPVPIP